MNIRKPRSMKTNAKKTIAPMNNEMMVKIMFFTVLIVAGLFLVKNITNGNGAATGIIGGAMAVFVLMIFLMHKRKENLVRVQTAIGISTILLVFIISLFSGDYLSDDFVLYLAVIALSGQMLDPKLTKYQAIAGGICLVLVYMICPQKADPLAQYGVCVGIYGIAAFLYYLVIRRGSAYIEVAEDRAVAAEKLISSMKRVGLELERNYENSSGRIDDLTAATDNLTGSTKDLEVGSNGIYMGTQVVEETCSAVQDTVQATEVQVKNLDSEVKKVEKSLAASTISMKEMNFQMKTVKEMVDTTNKVFDEFERQINEISAATEQLTKISSNTNILAINASVEAARAGTAGSGFAVVADEVRQLALDSDDCSNQVVSIVKAMQFQIEETMIQLKNSTGAINSSIDTLLSLENEFRALKDHFDSLYSNIEKQNYNVSEMDSMFTRLRKKIDKMSIYSRENQKIVTMMSGAMDVYKANITSVIDDTQLVRSLSSSMLEVVNESENERVKF